MPTKLAGTKYTLSDDFAVVQSVVSVATSINVRAYGAVGDGVTDDTAAVQAAIDAMSAGDALDFGEGTYLVSSAVRMSGSAQDRTGLTFLGRGAVIRLASGVASQNVAEIVSGANYRVAGLTFHGNKGTITPDGSDASYRYHNGLYVGAVAGKTLSNVRIEGCRFTAAAYCGVMLGSGPVAPGAILPGVDEVVVTGCQFDANEVGLSGGAYRKVAITGNSFADNDIYGCVADVDCVDVTISGNTFRTGTSLGATNTNIFAYNVDRVTITGNACDGGKTGILISTGVRDFTVTGNTVNASAADGIAVNNSTVGVVAANAVSSAGNYGISVSNNASQITINANTVRAASYDGIYLSSTSACMVSGNESVFNLGSGIYALSSSSLSVVGNLCLNNCASAGDAVSSGIRLNNCSQINVVANRCFDTNASPAQNYGLIEQGTSTNNTYVGNDFATNKLADTLFVGTANTYAANGPNSATVRLQNGTAAAPAYSFTGATGTGMYRTSGGSLGLAVGGSVQAVVQAVSSAVNFPVLRGSTDANVTIFPEGSGSPLNLLLEAKSTGGVRVAATGQSLAFLGGTPAAKQTVSGSRGSNAALESLLTALAAYGLITDSTTT